MAVVVDVLGTIGVLVAIVCAWRYFRAEKRHEDEVPPLPGPSRRTVYAVPAATATPWRWPQTRPGIMIGITGHLSVWRLEIVNGFPYAVTYGQPGA